MQENKQEKSPIKQKILLYLAQKNISQYEFYKNTDITRGVLTQNNGISEDNITRFLAYYPEVNAEWLLTGQGNMLKTKCTSEKPTSIDKPISKDKVTKNVSNNQETTVKKIPEGSHEGIPLIPFSAMAGALTGELTAMEYECERYVVPAFKGADFLMSVKGNSMTPTYLSGDIVACQRVPLTDLFFQWNKPYVLDTAQGALIKRIKPGTDTEHIRIISDNTEYDPYELPISAIHAVALVIGIIRLE